jgi:hypothetical protein
VRSPRRTGRDTSDAEENFRNLAIRRTGKTTVESPESQYQLLTLKARKRIDRLAIWLACQQSPQAHRGISASDKTPIKRAYDSNRRVALDVTHQQERDLTFRVGDDPMLAVVRLAGENRRQRAKRA